MLFDINKKDANRTKAKSTIADSVQRAKCGVWIGVEEGGGCVQFLTGESERPTAQELLGFIIMAERILTDRIKEQMERT